MTWIVSSLSIQGIKGVLDRAGEFTLAKKHIPWSIAIYAPNGCGKSGYANAVEYLFSRDGSVEHLGKGGADSECGGKHAIPHVLAEDKGIESSISMRLINTTSGDSVTVSRPVKTGRTDPMPSELAVVLDTAPVHRILRQHDLRRFVVNMSPSEKYSELSRWLGLEQLEQVLKHLNTTANKLSEANLDREIVERERDIEIHTSATITQYDESAVLQWCSAHAQQYLQGKLEIVSAEDLENVLTALRQRREQLILTSAAATTFQAKISLEQTASGLMAEGGLLDVCNSALYAAVQAEQGVFQAREKAKESAFKEVWTAAKQTLKLQEIPTCPVCLTPWQDTQAGSQGAALVRIEQSLTDLSALNVAENRQTTKATELQTALGKLKASLTRIQQDANALSLADEAREVREIVSEVDTLATGAKQPSRIQASWNILRQRYQQFAAGKLARKVSTIQIANVPAAAQEIADLVEHIQALQDALVRLKALTRRREEYRKVEQSFKDVADLIQIQTAALVNNVVDTLKQEALAVYQAIHPSGVVPNIYITPDTETRTLLLRVDFHSPDRTVPPAGYLCESHINTLGLALFIASVGLFNREFPFLFLDDIVSSYDADHRGRIVDMIAERLAGFQVFLTTHDWQFYKTLRYRLNDKGWQFERIRNWDLEHGPRRETDALRPAEIDLLIDNGDPTIAGNAVRQYMEEWLDRMCADYNAYTPHRRGPKEFERTLYDFWGPFIERLKKIKGSFFQNCVEQQLCYQRLKAHSLLNYYSPLCHNR